MQQSPDFRRRALMDELRKWEEGKLRDFKFSEAPVRNISTSIYSDKPEDHEIAKVLIFPKTKTKTFRT